METLINSNDKGSRFAAVEVVGWGYKLILDNLNATHEEIMSGEEEEVIGWGLVPYFVHLHSIQSDLNSLQSEFGNRAGKKSFETYFESYFDLCRNRVQIVQDPLLKGEPVPPKDFVRWHIKHEVNQSAYCIRYLKEEFQEGFTDFFNSYQQYVMGKTSTYTSKIRVIAFYLLETGEDPTALTRKEFENRFLSVPLSFFFKESNAENVQKEIRKAGFFHPGSSEYDAAKKAFTEDYEFANSLIC